MADDWTWICMAKVIFKVSLKRASSSGIAELLVRFYHGGVDCQTRSGILVRPELFDAADQRMKVNRRYNTPESAAAAEAERQIEEMRSHIYDEWLESGRKGVKIDRKWLQRVVAAFHGVTAQPDEVFVADMVRPYCEANNLAAGTRRQYKVLEGMIRRFGVAFRPMVVDKTTAQDLADFALFLRTEGATPEDPISRSQNTINSKMRRLSAIFRWLMVNDKCQTNPFARYVVPADVYGTPIFLTIAERDQLAAYPFAKECDRIQRDIFVFQCHVGCRVSDLMSFTPANIENGVIQYIQRKLKRSNASVVRVPLSQAALEIVERYKDMPDGRLLPYISDVKYNVAIKRILREAGIDRMVIVQDRKTCESVSVPICDVASSHLARRTFMANMYKVVKSERIVSSFTGHAAGSPAFRRYTEVDDEMKMDIIKEMEEISKKNPT